MECWDEDENPHWQTLTLARSAMLAMLTRAVLAVGGTVSSICSYVYGRLCVHLYSRWPAERPWPPVLGFHPSSSHTDPVWIGPAGSLIGNRDAVFYSAFFTAARRLASHTYWNTGLGIDGLVCNRLPMAGHVTLWIPVVLGLPPLPDTITDIERHWLRDDRMHWKQVRFIIRWDMCQWLKWKPWFSVILSHCFGPEKVNLFWSWET